MYHEVQGVWDFCTMAAISKGPPLLYNNSPDSSISWQTNYLYYVPLPSYTTVWAVIVLINAFLNFHRLVTIEMLPWYKTVVKLCGLWLRLRQ